MAAGRSEFWRFKTLRLKYGDVIPAFRDPVGFEYGLLTSPYDENGVRDQASLSPDIQDQIYLQVAPGLTDADMLLSWRRPKSGFDKTAPRSPQSGLITELYVAEGKYFKVREYELFTDELEDLGSGKRGLRCEFCSVFVPAGRNPETGWAIVRLL